MPGVPARLAAATLGLLVSAGAASAADLDVTGGLRGRYESLSGQYRPGVSASDQLVSVRANVAAELKFDKLTLGGELSDGRAFIGDSTGSVSSSDVNTLEPIQWYARYRSGPMELTAGRFTQDLGARRVISRSRSGNTTNAFTGVRGVWNGAQGSGLTALYALPVIRRPTDQASVLDNAQELDTQSSDYRLYGAFYVSQPLGAGVRAEVYGFRLTEADEAGRATRDRRLNLFGGRLFRNPGVGVLDFELEPIIQSGQTRASASARDVTDLDVSAFGLHAEAGWTFEGAWTPRLELALDYGSGDKDPLDRDYNRFDGFFGSRRGDFGPGGLYGPLSRSNYIAPVIRLDLVRPRAWEAYVNYRPLWLVEARDVFGNTGVQDATGRSGRFAGHAIDTRFRRYLKPNLIWDSGAAALFPEGFLERAPDATRRGTTLYGYSDLTWTF